MRKERKTMRVSELHPNTGQLEWLPRNPREWTQTDLDRTAASIREDEDFLEDRPLLVVPGEKGFVVFAGNLRLTAAKKVGLSAVPCMVYYCENPDEDFDTIIRRAMKDNGTFGAWDYDVLANEWDKYPLPDWGVPAWDTKEEGAGVDPNQFGDQFKLPEGDKSDFCTMSFQVSTRQRDLIEAALKEIKQTAAYSVMDTDGNNNSNGNALALIIEQYGTMQRDSD